MSSSSNYDINPGATPALPGRVAKYSQLRTPSAIVENLTVNLINGLPPPSAPPISAPVNSILTVTSPGVATFTDSALLDDVQANTGNVGLLISADLYATDLTINNELDLNGSIGTVGQIIRNTGSGQEWADLTTAEITPGTNGQALVTAGGVATWGNLPAANIVPGTSKQTLVVEGGIPTWETLPAISIRPGAANQNMVTNSLANQTEWSSDLHIDGELYFNGIYGVTGQFVKKTPSSQEWDNIVATDITPGTNGQALITSGGVSTWGNLPPATITPGTAYQIAQTNSLGTAAEWTSAIRPVSIQFNSSNQTLFDRYHANTAQVELFASRTNGTLFGIQNTPVDISYTIIGKLVTMTIYPFELLTFVAPMTSPAFLFINFTDPLLQPAHIYGASNYRQASFPFNSVTNVTTTFTPSMVNVYNQYFAYGINAIEFTFDDGITPYSVTDHGTGFTESSGFVMGLKYPLTITYMT